MSPEVIPLGMTRPHENSSQKSPGTFLKSSSRSNWPSLCPAYSPKAQHDEGFPLPHLKLIKGSKPVLASITQSGSVSLRHICYVMRSL